MKQIMLTIKYLTGVAISYLASFLLPVAPFLIFTFVLVVLDFITGVMAAGKRGEALRSRGFYRTVQKWVLYTAAILLSKGMDEIYFTPYGYNFNLTWIVATFIALTEFKSNLENISYITGTDIWNQIADRIPGIKFLRKK